MTPNLHSCFPTIFFSSLILLFHSPTLLSMTLKVFFRTPILFFYPPKIFSRNPNLLSCSPSLFSSTLLKYFAPHEVYANDNNYRNNKNKHNTTNGQLLTHAYGHRLADVHFAGFAPAFTLSLCDSEYARKPPVPIASVVRQHSKKKKKTDLRLKNL